MNLLSRDPNLKPISFKFGTNPHFLSCLTWYDHQKYIHSYSSPSEFPLCYFYSKGKVPLFPLHYSIVNLYQEFEPNGGFLARLVLYYRCRKACLDLESEPDECVALFYTTSTRQQLLLQYNVCKYTTFESDQPYKMYSE